MFVNFFYKLREVGIPATPTSFLRLQKALSLGLISSLEDFYTSARAILVKSERYFDLYDQVFAHYFKGMDLPDPEGIDLDEAARMLLEQWLRDPEGVAQALGVDPEDLLKLSPEELIEYFLKRLKDQTEAHHGGNKWIGTRGTSPVGHSGHHPGGMRVGGVSMNKSAVKVAMDRRYRDYSRQGPLTQAQMGEALKRLRHMVPFGPKDHVNIDETIYETMRNAGEIEIVFDRSLRDRLKIILIIDNGGWSMDPYVDLVQVLFDYSRNQFKDLKTYFFHNTIYDYVWADPPPPAQAPEGGGVQPLRPRDPPDHRGRCQHGSLRAHGHRRLHSYRRAESDLFHRPPSLPGQNFPPHRLAQSPGGDGVALRPHHPDHPHDLPHV